MYNKTDGDNTIACDDPNVGSISVIHTIDGTMIFLCPLEDRCHKEETVSRSCKAIKVKTCALCESVLPISVERNR
jgi:hypothetical protein